MQIVSVATQLRVTDLERALGFYVGVLGFVEEFRYEDFYAGVRAGDASARLHLKRIDDADPSIAFVHEEGHLHLYLRVPDLDAAFQSLQGRAEIVEPIATKRWGERELTIRDPDGHTIYLAEARQPSGE